MTAWTRNVNWTYMRRSKDIVVVFWMSYVCPSYVVCAGWLWKTIWYSMLFGKITDQKIWENDTQKRKFSVKNLFRKYNQIHRRLQIWSHLLKIDLMENFVRWNLRIGIWKEYFWKHYWDINYSFSQWLVLFVLNNYYAWLFICFIHLHFCKGLYFSSQYFLNSNNYINRRSIYTSNHTYFKNVFLWKECFPWNTVFWYWLTHAFFK